MAEVNTANKQDVGAALSALMYILPDDVNADGLPRNATVNELLSQIEADYNANSDGYRKNFKEELDACREIIDATKGLGQAEFLDGSWLHKGDYGTMNAGVFEIDGEIHVSYRGTGHDNWLHNAESAYGTGTSDMQEWARDYFEDALDKHYKVGNLYVSGHSQGGNNALFVTLDSRYSDRVTSCISVDGPGFNSDYINDYIVRNGRERYDALRGKCYAVYGENDPVHCVGEVNIIPEDQRQIVKTPTANGFPDIHAIFSHYGKNGKLNEITEPGPWAQWFEALNAELSQCLDREERVTNARALMKVIELFIGNKDIAEFLSGNMDLNAIIFLAEGLPIILDTVEDNPQKAREMLYNQLPFLKNLEKHLDQQWLRKFNFDWIIRAVHKMITTEITVSLGELKFNAFLISAISCILTEIPGELKDSITVIKKKLSQLRKDYIGSTTGEKNAENNPAIHADTALLRAYASRLEKVNTRLSQIHTALDRTMMQTRWCEFTMDSSIENDIAAAGRYLRCAADSLEEADRKVLACWKG